MSCVVNWMLGFERTFIRRRTSNDHSGQWGIFRGGKCPEYVPTRSNFPTVIQLGILPDYLQQYLAEYISYICGKMQNIQTDFPAGIIMGICCKNWGIFGVGICHFCMGAGDFPTPKIPRILQHIPIIIPAGKPVWIFCILPHIYEIYSAKYCCK